ncbi:MAG: type VI secretion system tip protein VgrG, partial [Gemmatimonadales bacterium]|nr:type VI secretion system tip protein VgrG [Gemmatimonadales bacterium]
MTAAPAQERLRLTVATPFGKDALLLRHARAEEEISAPFRISLEMISTKNDLASERILGQPVGVSVETVAGEWRRFHGIVTRFIQAASSTRFTSYSAEVRPWFWLLSLSSDCRVFQNQSVPDIVTGLFGELGFHDFRNALTAQYPAREYCVQYNETAFAFVCRLLEQEGIFYYFEHEADRHVLVLADDAGVHDPCPGASTLAYRPDDGTHPSHDGVTRCSLEHGLTSAKYAVDDFNFKLPTLDLMAAAAGKAGTGRRYEYPSGFDTKDAGERLAKARLGQLELAGLTLTGESGTPAMTAGYTFALSGHPRNDLNRGYLLQRVVHEADADGYRNLFAALPDDLTCRPARLTEKPRIHGSQTALVVGKSGEEIWTDSFGRIKVQFHWDQRGKSDQDSSCWIRVAQG